MADSDDGEYVADDMSDDFADHQVTSGRPGRAPSSRNKASGSGGGSSRRGNKKKKKADKTQAWEQVKRSWDDVVESQDGTLSLAPYLDAEKRKRLLADTRPLQRGIIRHLMLVVDMSSAMAEKDMLPTRYRLAIGYAKQFVREFFEQNPISQMGIVGMRDGVATTITQMGGNPAEHLETLEKLRNDQEPSGSPSLQNALEMCRGALFNTPSHGTREVVIIYGALLSADPGDIHDTIASLVQDRVRVAIIGLAAQVAICAELCRRTNSGDDSHYAVAMHEQHFEELLLRRTTPPATNRTAEQNTTSALLMMGFPSRTLASASAPATGGGADRTGGGSSTAAAAAAAAATRMYCVCHRKPLREGYHCTRCNARVCRLPIDCPSCGLTLILSTHLARSYHHLMPLKNYVEVPWRDVTTVPQARPPDDGKTTTSLSRAAAAACFACQAPFPAPPPEKGNDKDAASAAPEIKGVSESGRYMCTACKNHFCIDCDVFCHETLHNCPGCESNPVKGDKAGKEVVDHANGDHPNGAMVID